MSAGDVTSHAENVKRFILGWGAHDPYNTLDEAAALDSLAALLSTLEQAERDLSLQEGVTLARVRERDNFEARVAALEAALREIESIVDSAMNDNAALVAIQEVIARAALAATEPDDCVCAEINTRHCRVHGAAESVEPLMCVCVAPGACVDPWAAECRMRIGAAESAEKKPRDRSREGESWEVVNSGAEEWVGEDEIAAHAPGGVPSADERDPDCVKGWPDCVDGAYHPRCCRFPKSCSCGGVPSVPAEEPDPPEVDPSRRFEDRWPT